MLISAKNISRDQNRVVELPLSKSESNRALMIMHYSGIEELRNSGIQELKTWCLGVSVSRCLYQILMIRFFCRNI